MLLRLFCNSNKSPQNQRKLIPLINTAVRLLFLANCQLSQVSLDLAQFGGEALVLAGLNVEIRLHLLIHFGLDKLVRLLDKVANVAVNIGYI